MNLTSFLQQVKLLLATMSEEELKLFILDTARTLSEKKREEFLRELEYLQSTKDVKNSLYEELTVEQERIKVELAEIMEKLTQIESGQMCLNSELNEEYDSWYNSDEDEMYLTDPENLMVHIEKATCLVHESVDKELYWEAFQLASKLLSLEVMVNNEDYGDNLYTIEMLIDEQVFRGDIKKLVLDTLFATYYLYDLEERAGIIYNIITRMDFIKITLEMLLQYGKDSLQGKEKFLKEWIGYLGRQKGACAEKLLLEAIDLLNDSDTALVLARKYAKMHPSIFEQVLNQDSLRSASELMTIGLEALESIPPNFLIRSKVALMTAEFATTLDKRQVVEKCWLEAFRSDTTPVQYMRIILESNDFSLHRKAQVICNQYSDKAKRFTYKTGYIGEVSENKVDNYTYFFLALLNKDFQKVIIDGMKMKETLGWSSTFMKQGIAFFLILLNKNEILNSGCREMCQKVMENMPFTEDLYLKGTNIKSVKNDMEFFWNCFLKWKNTVEVTKDMKNEILLQLDYWIAQRTEGIMQANRRNYYGECASFISALGEVKESQGIVGDKNSFLLEYKAMFPRRSAFHIELREYGMMDKKAKK